MGKVTNIEWTDHTHNPWWGCEHAGTPGCDHCFAKDTDRRFGGGGHWRRGAEPRLFGDRYWKDPLRWNAAAKRDGVRRKVFCGSMCDVLQRGDTLDVERQRLFKVIADTPDLDWLLLSKRLENARSLLPSGWFDVGWPSHVWAGVSVEDQACAEVRLEQLGRLPAPVRFVSAEPLLGELDVQRWLPSVDWVIVGGESGMKARTLDPSWVLWLRAQCAQRKTPQVFKGWGKWLPSSQICRRGDGGELVKTTMAPPAGRRREHGQTFYAVGKKHSGALLGGHEYKQFPKGPHTS